MDGALLARRIDYAFLRMDSRVRVEALRDAVRAVQDLCLRALCVPPVLAGTVKKNYPQLRVCAVISYPLGLDSLAAKVFALQELIEQQVDEVDIVYDLFALVNDNRRKIELEAQRLGELTASAQVFHKAVIETAVLSEEQIRCAPAAPGRRPREADQSRGGHRQLLRCAGHARRRRGYHRRLPARTHPARSGRQVGSAPSLGSGPS
jgi:deoxyribose-phosphate aldolase